MRIRTNSSRSVWQSSKHRLFSYLLMLLSLVFVVRITLFVRKRTAYADIDVLAFVQIAIVFILGVFLILTPGLKKIIKESKGLSVRLFYVYFIIALLSGFWSVYQVYTFYRATEFIVLFGAVYVSIYYHKKFLVLERTILLVGLLIMVMGMGMHLILSNFVITIDVLHSNVYPTSAAMIFSYCFSEYFFAVGRRKKILFRYAAISTFFIIIGTSSASNISVLTALLVVTFLSRNKSLFLLILALSILLTALSPLVDYQALLLPGKSEIAIKSLTGRINIWNFYIDLIYDEPLLGYGFAASTRLYFLNMTNTHNGYLAVMLGTGLVGMIFFMGAIAKLFREAWSNIRYKVPGGIGCFAAVLAAFVNNLSVSIIGEQWNSSSMTLALFLGLHFWVTEWRRSMGKSESVKYFG